MPIKYIVKRKIVIGLLYFSAVASILGGIGLMQGKMGLPLSWLEPTSFTSYYFPGVILMAIVGGSALIAAVSQQKQLVGANLASVVAGTIMLIWVVGEIASIREINFMQFMFFAIGFSIVLLTPSDNSKKFKN